MSTALIDADIVAYRIAAWIESNQGDALDAYESVPGLMREWAERAGCTDIIACLSHPEKKSFRYDVLETYKHNRANNTPPELRRLCEDIIRDQFRTVEFPHLEGDDIMGILATNGKVKDPVMVTIDKDLGQVPGKHHNPIKDEPGQIRTITPLEGEFLFHTQWLIGDAGDGYGGIYRFGIKKATSMLEAFIDPDSGYNAKEAEEAIVKFYDEKHYEFAYCLQMAQCAKILQADNWDSEKKEIIPFYPSYQY